MNQPPNLPLILQSDQLRLLNEHLVKTTGCFAFLKTEQVVFSSSPLSWQDAYTIFGIGLYAVYHDYGCRFLRYLILDNNHCPDTLPEPNRHRVHVDTVNYHIRVNLAHGILHSNQRTQLHRKLANYYLCGSDYAADPQVWPDFINRLREADWMKITQRLVEDSDNLYSYLWAWGDAWSKTPSQLPDLQRQFALYNGCFSSSFDDRICRPLLLSHGIKSSDIGVYTGKESPNIKFWRQQLVQSYLSGMTHPEALYRKLELLIQKNMEPPQKSSIDIATQFGFCLK